MAQDITLLGASYAGVPAVELPKTGGGTARFDDTTDADAAAEDIASGKTAYVNGVKVTGTGSGGGGGGGDQAPFGDVVYFDFDGTIQASYSAADFLELTEPPANPSHPGLVAQGWNWPLDAAQAFVAEHGFLDIGQSYVTDDGKTRLHIRLTDSSELAPILGLAVKGTATISWGDGSPAETLTGSSLSTAVFIQHTYAAVGDYVISIGVSGTDQIAIMGANIGGSQLLTDSTNTTYRNQTYQSTLRRVELGTGCLIQAHAFRGCRDLTSITIPTDFTDIGAYAFYECRSFVCIALPGAVGGISSNLLASCSALVLFSARQVDSVGSNAFQECEALRRLALQGQASSAGSYAFDDCRSLRRLVLPAGLKFVLTYAFQSCYSLPALRLPDGLTSISGNAFSSCRSLEALTVPPKVTSIGANAFLNCSSMTELRLRPAIPPTITNANALPPEGILSVPWGSVSAYKSANIWADFAARMTGFADAGTFPAGSVLPAYNEEGHALTWYSDTGHTTEITVCPAGSPEIYCDAGGTKDRMVVRVTIEGDLGLTITDSGGNPVDLSLGFFTCESGAAFTADISAPAGYNRHIWVNGTKAATLPCTFTVTEDTDLHGTAYDPTETNPSFEAATWYQLKAAVDAGTAATLYADQLGATKEVELSNGETYHLRLANNTTDLYDYAGKEGTTGFVLEFVECLMTRYPMNDTNDNTGGWNASKMRTETLPSIFSMLPLELQDVISTVKTKASSGGSSGASVVESEDKLFLPAERETLRSRSGSLTAEWNALARWQYYAANDTSSARIKTRDGSASNWWLRSARNANATAFCQISASGSGGYNNASNVNGVSPAFAI